MGKKSADSGKLKSDVSPVKGSFKSGASFRSFSLKLMLAFISVVVLTGVILGLLSINSQKRTIEKLVVDKLVSLSNVVRSTFAVKMKEITTVISNLAAQREVKSFEGEKAEELFSNVLKTNLAVRKIILFDDKGEVVAERGRVYERVSYLNWWYIVFVRMVNQSVFVSNIFMHPLYGFPVIIVAVPVRDMNFTERGVLLAEVDVSELAKFITGINIGWANAYITTDDGRVVIVTSTKELGSIGKKLPNFGSSYVKEYKFFVGLGDGNRFNLKIYLVADRSVLFSPIMEVKRKIMFYVVLSVLLAVAMAMFITMKITNPIKEIVAGALAVASGDLDRSIEVKTGDEFEVLVESIETMRKNMKKVIDRISTLYNLGRRLSSQLEYEDLLDEIVKACLNIVPTASRVSIMIYDDESQELILEKAWGLPEEVEVGLRQKVDVGIAGWVFKTGEIYVASDVENDEIFKRLRGEKKLFGGSSICVPLKAKGSTIGVLNIATLEKIEFTKEQIEFIDAFSNLVAASLYNSILYKMAITDGMTKLYIHRYFQQRLDSELERARRYDEPLSLLMMDIDHFKKFNDTYGHQVGDRVLKTVAKIVRSNIRSVDIPCRYGGEEFAVILPAKSGKEALLPAERLRKAVESYDFRVNGKRVKITISIGVATFPEHAIQKQELIECADKALYWAKFSGRNRVVLYGSFDESELEKIK